MSPTKGSAFTRALRAVQIKVDAAVRYAELADDTSTDGEMHGYAACAQETLKAAGQEIGEVMEMFRFGRAESVPNS